MTTTRADAAIIGGGSIGCFAAYSLRKRGRAVVLLDRGMAGAQSSGVNLGSLRLQGRHLRQLPLSLRAQALWQEVEGLCGESVEFSMNGHLYVALDRAQLDKLEKMAVAEAAYDNRCDILGPEEMLRRWPFLSGDIAGGSWHARSATVNPRLVCPAVARLARRLGADIREGVAVERVERVGERFRATTDRGDTVEADHLINAAGAWALEIAAMFDETPPMFPAGPVQMATEPVRRFVEPVIHAADSSIIFRQVGRGNVLIAGHPRVPVDAEQRRARVPPYKMLENMRRLLSANHAMRPFNLIRTWTGIEGYLPDMLPVLGPSRTTPNLLHAFGFSGHGLQIAPAVGAVLAELIIDGKTETPIDAFSIDRFAVPNAPDMDQMRHEFDDTVIKTRIATAR